MLPGPVSCVNALIDKAFKDEEMQYQMKWVVHVGWESIGAVEQV